MNFKRQGDSTIQNLHVKDIGDRLYKFSFFEIVNESDIANEASIDVSAGELKVLQTLVKYSMPCLLGWNGAMDSNVIKLFLKAYS